MAVNKKKVQAKLEAEHPEWSIEELERETTKICKESNYQTIEYWRKKFPDKTDDELEVMRKEYVTNSKKKTPYAIEYWQAKYPDKNMEELLVLKNQYAKENCVSCIEYWRKKFPDKTDDELEVMRYEHGRKSGFFAGVSGERNGNSKARVDMDTIKKRSPYCIEKWIADNPDKTIEEVEALYKEFVGETHKKSWKKNKLNIEYYTAQGYSVDEAKLLLSHEQKSRTGSLENYIKRYGEEEGKRKFDERQAKWLASLHNTLTKQGDGRAPQSKFAKHCIEEICKFLHIPVPTREKYVFNDELKHYYAFDFCHGDKVIEFNGDYWHCNPNKYSADYVHQTMKTTTAQQIWDYDKQKQDFAQSMGYKYLVIWESEYNESVENTINKCIQFMKS